MTYGDPIEEQCVRMFRMVYGNVAQSIEEARIAFWQQEPTIISGWERLARSVLNITTTATIEHLLTKQA